VILLTVTRKGKITGQRVDWLSGRRSRSITRKCFGGIEFLYPDCGVATGIHAD
jgi:hypothetical protein